MPRIHMTATDGRGLARVWVDGIEQRDLTDFTLRMDRDDVARVELGMLVRDGLEITATATLDVTLRTAPGYRVIATPVGDGQIRYTCEAEPAEYPPAWGASK